METKFRMKQIGNILSLPFLRSHQSSSKTASLQPQTTNQVTQCANEVLDGWNHPLGLTGATLPHSSFFNYSLVKASNANRKQAIAVETFCEAVQ